MLKELTLKTLPYSHFAPISYDLDSPDMVWHGETAVQSNGPTIVFKNFDYTGYGAWVPYLVQYKC